jgi:hypothetical protein
LTGRMLISSTPRTRWHSEHTLLRYSCFSIVALRPLFDTRDVTLCWLHGTSVQKSWGHVSRRSIFPICIVFTKKYLCVKKIVSCPREENRATKIKRTLVLKRLSLLHSIKSPPLSLGAHDFYDSGCSHALFHLMGEASRSIHNAPPLRASSSCFPVLC